MTNPMTTTGDTIYSSSGSTPARLGIGSTGQVLTVAGGVPSWAAPAAAGYVGVGLRNEVAQTTSTGTAKTIDFTSESWDTDAFHDNSVNPSRITIPSGKGGKYLFTAFCLWEPNGTGRRIIRIMKNGSTGVALSFIAPSNNYAGNEISQIIEVAAGDYYILQIVQNSGGNLDTYPDFGPGGIIFQATYLGA
jgi:hypothetical protein